MVVCRSRRLDTSLRDIIVTSFVRAVQALAMYVTEIAVMNAANLGSTLLAATDAYIATVGFATYEVRGSPSQISVTTVPSARHVTAG